jgi:hypothetical protein
MGLRDRIRGVVKQALTGGGGPSSPKAAGGAVVKPSGPAPAEKPAGKPGDPTDGAWYLQGQEDIEGWDQTNPGSEPGKNNLREE